MQEFRITAIIPVLNRPKNVEPLIKSFVENSPKDLVDMLFVTSDSCQAEIREIKRCSSLGPVAVAVAPGEVLSWAKRINWGINHSKSYHHFEECAPWVLCGADDIIFHAGWFEAAKEAANGFSGVIGTNDLGNPSCMDGTHTTHPLVDRKYVTEHGTMDEVGRFLHEGYQHNFVDLELVSTAVKRGCWKHAGNCHIEHNHPSWNKNQWDEVYQRGQSNWANDRLLWLDRAAKFDLPILIRSV